MRSTHLRNFTCLLLLQVETVSIVSAICHEAEKVFDHDAGELR